MTELKGPTANQDVALPLQLPPESFLESILDGGSTLLQQQCTYAIPFASQALQHASGLLSIITMPLIRHFQESDIISAFQEYIPWLLDAYLRLHEIQMRWHSLFPSVLPLLLQNTLQFLSVFEKANSIDTCIRQKAFTLLVLLCMEMSSQSLGKLISDGQESSDYQLLCTSLAKIAKACIHSRPISRLVTSQLIPVLEKLMIGNEDAEKTDLWVSIQSRIANELLMPV